MQHSDDRPPASGRPSLLSAEQQGEADRQRILTGLESKPSLTTAGAQKARHGALKWAAAGAAVLALAAGAGAWLVSEGEKEIVLAGTAPLPATPAPAAPLASETVAAGAPAGEESAAAILQDTPVMAEKLPPHLPAAPRAKPAEELKSLLEKGLPAQAKRSAPPPLVLADASPYAGAPVKANPAAAPKPKPKPLKAPVAKPVLAKAAPPAPKAAPLPDEDAQVSNVQPKPVSKTVLARADAKVKAKPAPVKKKEAPSRAAGRVDSDVALLAALVAHSKAIQPKSASTNAAKLRQCKTLGSVADAEQCRTKLCAGSAKNEAECKPPRVVKTIAES